MAGDGWAWTWQAAAAIIATAALRRR